MKRSPRCSHRSGAVLAISLTMVLVIGLLLGGLMQRMVREQRQVRVRQHQWQAQWLARSALERANAKLAADGAYAGEVWKPALADSTGEVTIEIKPATEGQQRTISVVARYPAEHPLAARFSLNKPLSNQ